MSYDDEYRVIYLRQMVVDHEACAAEIQIVDLDESTHNAIITRLRNYADIAHENFGDCTTGVSKCTPPDEFDPKLGVDLAFWRAVERLTKKQLKLLDGKIRDNDAKLAHKEYLKTPEAKKAKEKALKKQAKKKK